MAQLKLRHPSWMNRMSGEEPGKKVPRRPVEDKDHGDGANKGTSILLMCAYFLGLASIAVVVVAGHFPWFTLAPAMVLLMAAHVRRVEAKFQRKSSGELLKT